VPGFAELGRVRETRGGSATVEIPVVEACRECGICKPKDEASPLAIEVANTIGAKAGDEVRVLMDCSRLRMSVLVFGIPSLLFALGLIAGATLADSPGAGLVAGLLLLAVHYLLIKRMGGLFHPRIERAD
jgi:positive regulator of sigma E activity